MWKQYDIPRREGTRIHRIGDAIVCIAAETSGEGELLAAMPMYPSEAKRQRATRAITLPPLDDRAWNKFCVEKAAHYELSPAYPPMPICIRLKESFSLAPGADLRGWIFSHIEVRILVGGSPLISFPLIRPFKTLYGTPDAGVVCRYDEAQFLEANEPMFDSMNADPGLVAHPVRLRNASAKPVSVTDLCIYGEQLSIMGDGSLMCSERLSFVFGSSGVRMSLDSQGPPLLGTTIITRPKVSGEERFIERSFELFKAMTRL